MHEAILSLRLGKNERLMGMIKTGDRYSDGAYTKNTKTYTDHIEKGGASGRISLPHIMASVTSFCFCIKDFKICLTHEKRLVALL